jgi:hypothetical protein
VISVATIKRSPKEYHRMSLVIDRKLHRAFKLAVTAEGKEMSEVLIAFIEQYVREHPVSAPRPKEGGRA